MLWLCYTSSQHKERSNLWLGIMLQYAVVMQGVQEKTSFISTEEPCKFPQQQCLSLLTLLSAHTLCQLVLSNAQ